MRRDLLPYYISRALLAAAFGWFFTLSWGLWVGALFGLALYAGFLWYAHSGRYLIDPSTPLFPLRRDDRGNRIRDRALVISVAVGGLAFVALWIATRFLPLGTGTPSLAFAIGVVTYFVASNWLFVRG